MGMSGQESSGANNKTLGQFIGPCARGMPLLSCGADVQPASNGCQFTPHSLALALTLHHFSPSPSLQILTGTQREREKSS